MAGVLTDNALNWVQTRGSFEQSYLNSIVQNEGEFAGNISRGTWESIARYAAKNIDPFDYPAGITPDNITDFDGLSQQELPSAFMSWVNIKRLEDTALKDINNKRLLAGQPEAGDFTEAIGYDPRIWGQVINMGYREGASRMKMQFNEQGQFDQTEAIAFYRGRKEALDKRIAAAQKAGDVGAIRRLRRNRASGQIFGENQDLATQFAVDYRLPAPALPDFGTGESTTPTPQIASTGATPAAEVPTAPTQGLTAPAPAPAPAPARVLNTTRDQIEGFSSVEGGRFISGDFNDFSDPNVKGFEIVMPSDSTAEELQVAETWLTELGQFFEDRGIPRRNRGVKVVGRDTDRGAKGVIHLEPFFAKDIEARQAIEADPAAYAALTKNTIGTLQGSKFIPPHRENDTGAVTPDGFNERDWWRNTLYGAFAPEDIQEPPAPTQTLAKVTDQEVRSDRFLEGLGVTVTDTQPLIGSTTDTGSSGDFRQQLGGQQVQQDANRRELGLDATLPPASPELLEGIPRGLNDPIPPTPEGFQFDPVGFTGGGGTAFEQGQQATEAAGQAADTAFEAGANAVSGVRKFFGDIGDSIGRFGERELADIGFKLENLQSGLTNPDNIPNFIEYPQDFVRGALGGQSIADQFAEQRKEELEAAQRVVDIREQQRIATQPEGVLLPGQTPAAAGNIQSQGDNFALPSTAADGNIFTQGDVLPLPAGVTPQFPNAEAIEREAIRREDEKFAALEAEADVLEGVALGREQAILENESANAQAIADEELRLFNEEQARTNREDGLLSSLGFFQPAAFTQPAAVGQLLDTGNAGFTSNPGAPGAAAQTLRAVTPTANFNNSFDADEVSAVIKNQRNLRDQADAQRRGVPEQAAQSRALAAVNERRASEGKLAIPEIYNLFDSYDVNNDRLFNLQSEGLVSEINKQIAALRSVGNNPDTLAVLEAEAGGRLKLKRSLRKQLDDVLRRLRDGNTYGARFGVTQ